MTSSGIPKKLLNARQNIPNSLPTFHPTLRALSRRILHRIRASSLQFQFRRSLFQHRFNR